MLNKPNYGLDIPFECKDIIGLINRIVNKYSTNARCSKEDLLNVAYAACIAARKVFKFELGTKFSSFAYPVISNAVKKEYIKTHNALSGCHPHQLNKDEDNQTLIEYQNKHMASIQRSTPKIDTSGNYDPILQAEKKEIQEQVNIVIDTLPPDSQDVIRMRMNGEQINTIADTLGLTPRVVSYRLEKYEPILKAKFKKIGLDTYA